MAITPWPDICDGHHRCAPTGAPIVKMQETKNSRLKFRAVHGERNMCNQVGSTRFLWRSCSHCKRLPLTLRKPLAKLRRWYLRRQVATQGHFPVVRTFIRRRRFAPDNPVRRICNLKTTAISKWAQIRACTLISSSTTLTNRPVVLPSKQRAARFVLWQDHRAMGPSRSRPLMAPLAYAVDAPTATCAIK